MDSIIEGPSEVVGPVSLVETTELITSEKLVWAALTLYAGVKGRRRLSQMQLAAKLGYCRQTVAKAIDRLETLGWYTANPKLRLPKLAGKVIRVAARLLLDTSIGAGARLMHMQLLVRLQVAEARRGTFQFKFATLSRELHKGIKSVRRAVEHLKQERCRLWSCIPRILALGTLLQKVKGLLPLRNLLGGESLIRFLESACANYRRKSPEFTIY